MQMLCRGAAGGADFPKHFTRLNLLALADSEAPEMSIAGREAVVMPNLDEVSVPAHHLGPGDDAGPGCPDRVSAAASAPDVQARVVSRPAAPEWRKHRVEVQRARERFAGAGAGLRRQGNVNSRPAAAPNYQKK